MSRSLKVWLGVYSPMLDKLLVEFLMVLDERLIEDSSTFDVLNALQASRRAFVNVRRVGNRGKAKLDAAKGQRPARLGNRGTGQPEGTSYLASDSLIPEPPWFCQVDPHARKQRGNVVAKNHVRDVWAGPWGLELGSWRG